MCRHKRERRTRQTQAARQAGRQAARQDNKPGRPTYPGCSGGIIGELMCHPVGLVGRTGVPSIFASPLSPAWPPFSSVHSLRMNGIFLGATPLTESERGKERERGEKGGEGRKRGLHRCDPRKFFKFSPNSRGTPQQG